MQVIKLVKEEEDAQAKEGGDGGRGEHSTHSYPLFDAYILAEWPIVARLGRTCAGGVDAWWFV